MLPQSDGICGTAPVPCAGPQGFSPSRLANGSGLAGEAEVSCEPQAGNA